MSTRDDSTRKKQLRSRKKAASLEVTQLSEGFFLGRHRDAPIRKLKVKRSQTAGVLLRKVARALEKPGIRREAIFPPGVSGEQFAYSVDPQDPRLIIRESSSGEITRGRFVGGRFKTL